MESTSEERMTKEVKFGPTGQVVYDRTYSRPKPDGTKETWPETAVRVVDGNLALVPNAHLLPNEREDLIRMITDFKIIPAGRHLWASGVKGRQFLFNCHVAGWSELPWEHFEFTFLRLMEGGGVGSNYSNRYLDHYPAVAGYRPHGQAEELPYEVHIVCDPAHPDYQKMKDEGLLSDEYADDWAGAFEVEDSREGWAAALVDLIQTYFREAKNRKRVFDVSRIRPEGWRLKSFGGRASGPLPLARMLHEVADVLNSCLGRKLDGMSAMDIDHAIAKCVVSGGVRRSARMSIMHWADPQIEKFIDCKRHGDGHWTTNISVEVDDEFFARVNAGRPDASFVLAAIAEGMLTNGEPGFWNSSLSNVGEPRRVVATNPCGEIVLMPWEPCNLGHVNLAAFVKDNGNMDMEGLEKAHRLMARFLIRATYGDVTDPKQAKVLAENRRIGVGHLGVASALAMMGIKYSEAPNSHFPYLLGEMRFYVQDEARKYAHDLRIPVPVKTTTVAPTGTIAKMPGVSEGIHPIFAKYFIRRVRFSDVDPEQRKTVEEYRRQGYGVEPDRAAPATTVVSLPTKDILMAEVESRYGEEKAEEVVQSAADLSLQEMLRFQAMYQERYADNAVSFTVNIDPDRYSVEDLATAISQFGPLLKGATVFPEKSIPQAPYERISKADYQLYEYWQQQVSDGVDEECANGSCPIR